MSPDFGVGQKYRGPVRQVPLAQEKARRIDDVDLAIELDGVADFERTKEK